jgi:hypothetical protein
MADVIQLHGGLSPAGIFRIFAKARRSQDTESSRPGTRREKSNDMFIII